MELHPYGVTIRGLFEAQLVDPYDKFLTDSVTKYVPPIQQKGQLKERDKIVDDAYKFIFDYRGLQQSRYQTLLQKLNSAFNATLDRAFAANGAARAGAIPLLRNYWELWMTDAYPTGITNWYAPQEPPANVQGGGNIKAMPVRSFTFTPFNTIPTTRNPIGVPTSNFGNPQLYTDSAQRGTPARPAIGENPFLKALFTEFIRVETQEMFSQFHHMPGEFYIAGNASDSFGSSLSATVLVDYDITTQQMKISLNKATAFYHS